MEDIASDLLKELNCDTAFTIPVFGGIEVAESVVVTWIIMAVMVIFAIVMTRKLRIQNPSKRQVIIESIVTGLQNMVKGFIGENGCWKIMYLLRKHRVLLIRIQGLRLKYGQVRKGHCCFGMPTFIIAQIMQIHR